MIRSIGLVVIVLLCAIAPPFARAQGSMTIFGTALNAPLECAV